MQTISRSVLADSVKSLIFKCPKHYKKFLVLFVIGNNYVFKSTCKNKVHVINCHSVTVLLSYGKTKEHQFAREKD